MVVPSRGKWARVGVRKGIQSVNNRPKQNKQCQSKRSQIINSSTYVIPQLTLHTTQNMARICLVKLCLLCSRAMLSISLSTVSPGRWIFWIILVHLFIYLLKIIFLTKTFFPRANVLGNLGCHQVLGKKSTNLDQINPNTINYIQQYSQTKQPQLNSRYFARTRTSVLKSRVHLTRVGGQSG